VSQEFRSARQIIALLQEDMNTLKKDFMQDDTSGNMGLIYVNMKKDHSHL
jgi:hypothetical protein